MNDIYNTEGYFLFVNGRKVGICKEYDSNKYILTYRPFNVFEKFAMFIKELIIWNNP